MSVFTPAPPRNKGWHFKYGGLKTKQERKRKADRMRSLSSHLPLISQRGQRNGTYQAEAISSLPLPAFPSFTLWGSLKPAKCHGEAGRISQPLASTTKYSCSRSRPKHNHYSPRHNGWRRREAKRGEERSRGAEEELKVGEIIRSVRKDHRKKVV